MNGKYYLKVLRGTGGGNFIYMNSTWGIKDTAASAVDDGLTFGDLDNDGDLRDEQPTDGNTESGAASTR